MYVIQSHHALVRTILRLMCQARRFLILTNDRDEL